MCFLVRKWGVLLDCLVEASEARRILGAEPTDEHPRTEGESWEGTDLGEAAKGS